jgi:hypothetical protein
MSFSYDRYDRRQSSHSRSTFGYWVPLVLTVTVATAGVVAWVWSERREEDDSSDDADLSYGEDRDGKTPGGPRDNTSMSQGVTHEDESLVGRVQGVLRRTPSPQQVFDAVSKRTAAGVAAASAAAGAALASIREEDRDDLQGDHSRWSEEAALRRHTEAQSSQSTVAVDTQTKSFAASVRGAQPSGGRRKTVAIVVSAESLMDSYDEDGSYRSENAVS